ncbi:hypothetical protein [Enterococcus durans]|uniref:hypothetical protein n=1 Tax=Enterococcus durans TaxID=53345 RepID=UPI0021AF96E1|nr:hypothetical protein [Enterococcus durans]
MDTKLTDETAWNETITATYRKDPNYSYRMLEIHNQVLDLVENRLTPHPDDLKELYSIYFNIIKNDHSRKFVEKKNRLTVAKSIYRSISVYPSVQLLKKSTFQVRFGKQTFLPTFSSRIQCIKIQWSHLLLRLYKERE